MKRVSAEWFFENWRWIIYISLMSVIIPSFIYHLATVKPELWDSELRKQAREDLEKEMKEINLPSQTAVNKFNGYDKRFSIFIQTRYRTEISEKEFMSFLSTELKKKGWIYYGRENSAYQFCRGQADASISSAGSGGLFNDGANYFELSFKIGTRPQFDFSNSRPITCK